MAAAEFALRVKTLTTRLYHIHTIRYTSSRQNLYPEFIATLPPFGPIEGHKWFLQISSQWESQTNRSAFISYGKIQFLPPCISRSLVHVVPPLHQRPTGRRLPPPFPLRIAKTGKNHLNEEIIPILPTWIGERFSQAISNLGHAALLRRYEPL